MSLFSRDGMLTGTEIERRVKKGHIQITPYDPKCVNPNSYNLKLHPQLLIYKRDAERANITPHVTRTFENTSINNCDIMHDQDCETVVTDISNISYLDEPARDHDEGENVNTEPVQESEDRHDTECGSDCPTVTEVKTNRSGIGFMNLVQSITDRFKELKGETDEKINALEIKSLPIVESNYLPPLDMHKKNETIEFQIPEEGYVLQPGVLYIGRTVERTATDRFIPMINGRSSGGRLGISIHICAGFGDIGFDGTWTLEITVVEPVRIYPNEEIAQVCFFTPAGKKAKLYRGRYYKQEDATASRFHQPKKEY